MLKTLLMEAFMQIKGLHKNIYKLYGYARTQECLDVYRKKYEDKVHCWEKLRSEGVSIKTARSFWVFPGLPITE